MGARLKSPSSRPPVANKPKCKMPKNPSMSSILKSPPSGTSIVSKKKPSQDSLLTQRQIKRPPSALGTTPKATTIRRGPLSRPASPKPELIIDPCAGRAQKSTKVPVPAARCKNDSGNRHIRSASGVHPHAVNGTAGGKATTRVNSPSGIRAGNGVAAPKGLQNRAAKVIQRKPPGRQTTVSKCIFAL